MPRNFSRLCRFHFLLGTLLLAGEVCCAQQQVELPRNEAPMETVSRPQFIARVLQLGGVVAGCKLRAASCSGDIGPDLRATGEGSNAEFVEHWNWLRDACQSAMKQNEKERVAAMSSAAEHLSELAMEADPGIRITNSASIQRVEKKAEEVLARAEFRPAAAGEPSWLDRRMAQFWMWFGSLFEGARRLGSALPWLGKLLEWGLFILAAAGLLLFIRRTFARQQLHIALSAGPAQFSAWQREANDWASEADARAAKSEWRDAVHCLYWAAIVRLEAKRAWRHNPSRTPREYVRLLQGGSSQQTALRGLTGIFERVWYGLREAEVQDYERARSLFTELSQNTPATPATAGER